MTIYEKSPLLYLVPDPWVSSGSWGISILRVTRSVNIYLTSLEREIFVRSMHLFFTNVIRLDTPLPAWTAISILTPHLDCVIPSASLQSEEDHINWYSLKATILLSCFLLSACSCSSSMIFFHVKVTLHVLRELKILVFAPLYKIQFWKLFHLRMSHHIR